jgi:hypothetical protein
MQVFSLYNHLKINKLNHKKAQKYLGAAKTQPKKTKPVFNQENRLLSGL